MSLPVVFISYSHQDESEKQALLAHLGVLQHAGLIEAWSDDRIGAGRDWEQDIYEAMGRAKVAILLVTTNFLTSDFILGQEVPGFLERRRNEGLVVFPVIAKPCAWKRVDWLARMEVRPNNARPVWSDGGSHADEDLAAIAEEVARIVETHQGEPDQALGTAAQRESPDRDRWSNQGGLTIPSIGRYNLRNIRKLLTTAFTDVELRRLCYDVPQFRPVYEQFSAGMGKDQLIQQLMEYCERKGLLDVLLAVVQDEVPGRYAEFADKLRPGPPATATSESSPPAQPEVTHLQELITIKTRRLNALQLRAAQYGLSTPPEIMIEIEDLEAQIFDLKQQLNNYRT